MRQRRIDEWIPQLSGSPIRPHQRPLTPIEHRQLAAQVSEWLCDGIIEPIPTQPLNNNLVFVEKKTGGTRVCIDCTPVNAVTTEYDWPIPKLHDIWPRLHGARVFTRIDLQAAFFQIKVPQPYRNYTAFTCHGQQYQFRRMPFGVTNGPSFFQQYMDTHLSEFTNVAIWYVDDILIHATNLRELRQRTTRIKRKIKNMGCTVNESKSEYEKRALLFVGVWVFPQGSGPNLELMRQAASLPIPTTKATMQSALGLVSYLRDFLPLTAHFTASLYPTNERPLLPPTELQEQWQRLISHIKSAACSLRHWRDGEPADLYADASGVALGVVLIQHKRIVAVASRKLNPAEARYSATDREHLALVYAAKKFRLLTHQSEGRIRFFSDHEALLGRKIEELTPRQTRWLTIIRQWIPTLHHVKGIHNPADFFSRWPVEIIGGAIRV